MTDQLDCEVVQRARNGQFPQTRQCEVNGLLADFFSSEAIVEGIIEVLDHRDQMQAIREQARQTILDEYDLTKLLPIHLNWMQGK